ncbi:unnamed protein product [Aphanomyces euteiches]
MRLSACIVALTAAAAVASAALDVNDLAQDLVGGIGDIVEDIATNTPTSTPDPSAPTDAPTNGPSTAPSTAPTSAPSGTPATPDPSSATTTAPPPAPAATPAAPTSTAAPPASTPAPPPTATTASPPATTAKPSPTPALTIELPPIPTLLPPIPTLPPIATTTPKPSPTPTTTLEPPPAPTTSLEPPPAPTTTLEPSPDPTTTVPPPPSPDPTTTVPPPPSPDPTTTAPPPPTPTPTTIEIPTIPPIITTTAKPSPTTATTLDPPPAPTTTAPSPSPTTVDPAPAPTTVNPAPVTTTVPSPGPTTANPAPVTTNVPSPTTVDPTPVTTTVPSPGPTTANPAPVTTNVPSPTTVDPTPVTTTVPSPGLTTANPSPVTTNVPSPTPVTTNVPSSTTVEPSPASTAPTPTSGTPTSTPSTPPSPVPTTGPTSTPDSSTTSPPKTYTVVPTDLPVVTTPVPSTQSVFTDELFNKTTTTPPPDATTPKPVVDNLVSFTTPSPMATDANGAPINNNSGGSTSSGSDVATDNTDHSDKRRQDIEAKSPEAREDLKASITTGSESKLQQTLRYLSSSIVGITLVLMAFFQFIAMNPSYILPDSPNDRFAAPNSWEFPMFISFVQQVGVLSLAKNTKVPQKFYVNYVDSLSWMEFLIRGTSSSSSSSGVSSTQLLSLVNSTGRLLADDDSGYDAQGKLQFSLRSDINDKDWFVRVWVAILVVIAAIMVFVIATALISQWVSQRGNPFHSDSTDSHKRSVSFRSISRRLLGMCVLVGFFAILPLSMICMFETLQEASSTGIQTYGILSIATLALLVGGVLYGMWALQNLTEAGLSKWRTRVVWGVVYSNYHYTSRLFFGATALVQFLTGVLVAAITKDAVTQLLSLIIVQVLYLLAMILLQPFACSVHFKFAVAFQLLIVLVYGLACGMTGSNLSVDMQKSLSYAVIISLMIIFVAMFVRQLFMLWTYASAWAKDENESITGMPTLNDHEIESGAGNYTISLRGIDSSNNSGSHNHGTNASNLSPMNTIRIVDTNTMRR